MIYPRATKTLKCDVQANIEYKWEDFVDGGNGCLYGIPDDARRVVEFTVEDKKMKEIGPDLGDLCLKYINGIKADNGSIYCMPRYEDYFLKIIPREEQNAEVQILKEKNFPRGRWEVVALANDGCIYYFPLRGMDRILKLDPNDGDSLSLVGEKIEGDFIAAVLGNDGYIYGISHNRIIKFSPIDHSVSYIGKTFERTHFCKGLVLAEDGNIYAATQFGQILIIDTVDNNWKIIGNRIYQERYGFGWGRPVLGADKCIYFPPFDHNRVLKFNPMTQNISLIGESYVEKNWKWEGAELASDGYIYCISPYVDNILQIDSRHVNEQVVAMIENWNIGEIITD